MNGMSISLRTSVRLDCVRQEYDNDFYVSVFFTSSPFSLREAPTADHCWPRYISRKPPRTRRHQSCYHDAPPIHDEEDIASKLKDNLRKNNPPLFILVRSSKRPTVSFDVAPPWACPSRSGSRPPHPNPSCKRTWIATGPRSLPEA